MKIFQKDTFSDPTIVYKATDVPFESVETVVRKFVQNAHVIEVEELDSTAVHSRNFKVHCKDNQRYLLREHTTLEKGQILFYSEVSFKLKESGGPVVVPHKTIQGDWLVVHDGKLYALYTFVAGEYFFPSYEAFGAVAEALANLHLAFSLLDGQAKEYIDELSQHGDIYYNVVPTYEPKDFEEIGYVIEKKKTHDEIDALILSKMPFFVNRATQLASQEADIKALSVDVIHSDMHPHNMLMTGETVTAIMDLGAIRLSQQARDVAFAIHRLGRQFFAHDLMKPTPETVSELVNSFLSRYSAVRPLSRDEIELLPALITDEFLKKILFVLGWKYRMGEDKYGTFVPAFLSAIDEIDVLWGTN
jgi:Ser/Thr protein kinase RdoA (MazF antagonist)